ncbi:MAG: right-handed parallel beta-helix repeat-containing protein, partial [Pseudomonas chlororaphis]
MNSPMNSPAIRGSISLLAGAMLLASSAAFANVEPAPAAAPGKQPTVAKELQQAKTYTVSSAPTAPLNLAKPALPDLSGYTAEAAAAKIVRSKPGKISVRRMMQEDALKDFIGGDNKMAEWVVRQHGIPQAIFIDDGYVNLKELAKKLPKQYISETSPGVYLARLPIVVGRKGILEIDQQTQELRLSQEGGSFLVNDGQLFVRDTKVTGWREKDNGPATFNSPKEFRPFLLA